MSIPPRNVLPQKFSLKPLVLCAVSLGLAVAGTSVANAQESVANPQETEFHKTQLEEVVVTGSYTTREKLDSATGLGLSILETPQSVSVMTEQRILDQGLSSLMDVIVNVPGVSAKERDSSRDFYAARGFIIDNYQIDGVPIAWSSGGDAGETKIDTAIYERIEVVRGATGLLTGLGNPAASINLVRKHANSDVLTGYVNVGAGRWNHKTITADVSTPFNSDASVRGRTVVKYEDSESHVDLLENNKTVFYAVVDADVTDKTLVRVGASYQDNDPTSSTWGGLPAWYNDGTRTDWERSKTIGADWTRWASVNENYFINVVQDLGADWRFKVNASQAVNSAELELLYLWGQPDKIDGTGAETFGSSPYKSDTEREQTTFDIHLSGTFVWLDREHELSFGYMSSQQDFITYYFASDDDGMVVDNFNAWDGSYPEPTWGARSTDIETETEQTGLYGASRFHLSDVFKFVVGARLAEWEETGNLLQSNRLL